MWPLLRSGSEIEVRRLSTSVPARHTVLVFVAKGRIVVHRVVRTESGAGGIRFVTQGDAKLREDPAVEPECVIGEAVQVRRGPLVLRLDRAAHRRLSTAFGRTRARAALGRMLLRRLLRRFIGTQRTAGGEGLS